MPPPRPASGDTIVLIWKGDHYCMSMLACQYNQPKRPGDLGLWPFDLDVGVTCDVGYLCANFGLPRPLCSWFRPDVRERQTDVRRQTASSLNAPWARAQGPKSTYSRPKRKHNVYIFFLYLPFSHYTMFVC